MVTLGQKKPTCYKWLVIGASNASANYHKHIKRGWSQSHVNQVCNCHDWNVDSPCSLTLCFPPTVWIHVAWQQKCQPVLWPLGCATSYLKSTGVIFWVSMILQVRTNTSVAIDVINMYTLYWIIIALIFWSQG